MSKRVKGKIMTTNVNSVGAPQANNESYKPNYVTSVMRDALFGAAAGFGISYAWPSIQADEFIAKGVELKSNKIYEARVKDLHTKVETLTKEIEGITDETLKAAKSKELARTKQKLVNKVKHGAKGYHETVKESLEHGAHATHKLNPKDMLSKEFELHKNKKLETAYKDAPEAMAEFKNIIKKVKLDKANRTAKIGAIFCGLAGVVSSILTARMIKKAEKAKAAQGM